MMLLDASSRSLVTKMRCLVLPVLLVFCCCFARASASLPGNIPLYFPTAENPAPGWWADYGAVDGFPVSSNATAQVWQLRQAVYAACSMLEDETGGHFGHYCFQPTSTNDVLGLLMDDISYDAIDGGQSVSIGMVRQVWYCLVYEMLAPYASVPWFASELDMEAFPDPYAGNSPDDSYLLLSGQLQFLFDFEFNDAVDSVSTGTITVEDAAHGNAVFENLGQPCEWLTGCDFPIKIYFSDNRKEVIIEE